MSDVDENGGGGSFAVLVFPILMTIVIHIFFITPAVRTGYPVGIFTWILYYLSGIVGGMIAAAIANKLRIALMPDSVYTSDGFWGLLKAKVFWAVGPQFVASIIIPFTWVFLRFPS